jgi:hypothetical protein
MPQLSLWTLLHQTQQHDAHRQLQQQLPDCLTAPRGHPELWRIDYAPQGYRALHQGLQIFTELQPSIAATIEQAIDIAFLTETLPLPDLELLFDSFGGVLPARFQHTLSYLECAYPHHFGAKHR